MTTFFFVTLMNCDLNVYSHIPCKPLQDCDYRQNNLTEQWFHARIKVLIVFKNYMCYLKLYYVLLNLKKVMIFAYFNVKIYSEFEFLNY
jgi:hypothetical protein